MSESGQRRLVRLQERATWLEGAIERTQASIRRTPYYFTATLLAIPVGLIFGTFPALLVVTATLGIGSTLWYIEWVHKREYELELDVVTDELERMESAGKA